MRQRCSEVFLLTLGNRRRGKCSLGKFFDTDSRDKVLVACDKFCDTGVLRYAARKARDTWRGTVHFGFALFSLLRLKLDQLPVVEMMRLLNVLVYHGEPGITPVPLSRLQ